MPRKTTTLVECSLADCNATAEVGSDAQEAPEGWYLVVPATESSKYGHTYDRNNGVFEFHSLRCVEKWSKGRRQFEQGTPAARTSNSDVSLRQQLLEAAREYGEDFTPADILQVMGLTGDSKSVVNTLNRMWHEGDLILVRAGKPFGQQSPMYRAKAEAQVA